MIRPIQPFFDVLFRETIGSVPSGRRLADFRHVELCALVVADVEDSHVDLKLIDQVNDGCKLALCKATTRIVFVIFLIEGLAAIAHAPFDVGR